MSKLTKVQLAENLNKALLGDVFSLFIGQDKFRPAMHKPFEINGKVYATDAYTLVRTDKANIDFVLDNEHTPTSRVLFKVGVCEILLMPVIYVDKLEWDDVLNIA